jgi:hypothetical protein
MLFVFVFLIEKMLWCGVQKRNGRSMRKMGRDWEVVIRIQKGEESETRGVFWGEERVWT